MKTSDQLKTHSEGSAVQIKPQNNEDIYNMLIWTKIKYFREIQWLTQQQLATEADISKSYISHIETNLKLPNLKTISKIAQALSVWFDELIKILLVQQLKEFPWSNSDKVKLIEEVGQIYQKQVSARNPTA